MVDDVMTAQPYASARRVFWVVDNGSSHRGEPLQWQFTRADLRRLLASNAEPDLADAA